MTFLLCWAVVVQVRSQQRANQSLELRNPSDLALLIYDLQLSNGRLQAEVSALSQQQSSLSRALNTGTGTPVLQQEVVRLEIVTGEIPVHGPGVTITVAGQIGPQELQDMVNQLLAAGAESLAIDNQRVVNGSPITRHLGQIYVNQQAVTVPYTITAVGDPQPLGLIASELAAALKSTSGITMVLVRTSGNLEIRAVLPPRPMIYASPS